MTPLDSIGRLRTGSHRGLRVELTLRPRAQVSPDSSEVPPTQARERRSPGTDQTQAPAGESAGWGPGLRTLPQTPVPPPSVVVTHPPSPTPSSRRHQALLCHSGALGSQVVKQLPLAPMAQGPLVLGPREWGWHGAAGPPGILLQGQPGASRPRPPTPHPSPGPRESHRQESHPEWGSHLKPSAQSCKGSPDVHTQPQQQTPTNKPTPVTGRPVWVRGVRI